MTREEIIKYLNIIKAFFLGSEHQPISDAYFALDEASKALEQEPCEDCPFHFYDGFAGCCVLNYGLYPNEWFKPKEAESEG